MPLTPSEWNVVVLGRWNRAILTPSGIAKRLFCLDEETPVEVFVAVDALVPPQVKYGGTVVVAGEDRLIAQPETPDFHALEGAMTIARRAMESLPETPVIAVGVNVKYTSKEPIEALQHITRHPWWDDQLSDKDYEIVGRSLSRALKWRDGQINVSVSEERDASLQIQFNFHRASTKIDELKRWLSTPCSDLEDQCKQILLDSMKITPEDWDYAVAAAEA